MDEYIGAHLRGLVELVPPYMAGAINKYEENGTMKAGVRMQFPCTDLDLPCAITFDVLDEKIPFLAQTLFNAHLERDGAAWRLYYSEDARTVKIGDGTVFQHCTTEAIPGLFGPLITVGNAASPQRQRETGLDVTRTVTMELHSEMGRGALITVSLGSVEGSQLFEKLYS